MYYKITCGDFATQEGDFDLIGTCDGVVYVENAKTLKKPFSKVSESELPFTISQALNAKSEAINIARSAKLSEIDNKRDEMIAQGVEYNGKTFQSGEHDQALLTQAVTLFSASGGSVPNGYTWIAKDNSRIEMTLAQLIELGSLMALRVNTYYQKARDLKDKAVQATTLAEIQAIEWIE